MLNRHVEQGAWWKTVARLRVWFENYVGQILIEGVADMEHVIVDDIQGGPIGGQIGGKSAANWIDAEGEQAIKLRMSTLQSAGRSSFSKFQSNASR